MTEGGNIGIGCKVLQAGGQIAFETRRASVPLIKNSKKKEKEKRQIRERKFYFLRSHLYNDKETMSSPRFMTIITHRITAKIKDISSRLFDKLNAMKLLRRFSFKISSS